MWTDTTRKQFGWSGLRLPSDLTDAEWAVIEPLLPPRSQRGGRGVEPSADRRGAALSAARRPAVPDAAARPVDVLASIRHRFPWLRHVFADGGYAGAKLRAALARIGKWTLEIIKRCDRAKGFEVLLRRWVVERTFAWLGRNCRLAKDFEQTIESATAWLYLASIQLITRRIPSHGITQDDYESDPQLLTSRCMWFDRGRPRYISR
jgi:transposase